MFLKLVPTKRGKSLWLRVWPECQPSAISHHSSYVMFAVHGQQTCEMNVNEAAPSFCSFFFVGSWSLSNIWTPPPPHSLKTNPALNALKRKKKAVTRCKFRVNCAPRRWVVLTPGYLSPVHFTFYPLRHVFFFPVFFFPSISPLYPHLLLPPLHTSSPQNQISTALVSIATGYHGN